MFFGLHAFHRFLINRLTEDDGASAPCPATVAASPSAPGPCPTGISAIIPTYNYARFLPDAIESVLAQDYPDLEVIVVDDGSTDNTRDVCARYGERIRYVYQTNQGLSAARNTGLREARFDLVAFLDSDDLWRSDKLSRQMQVFAALPLEFGLIATGRQNVSVSGEPQVGGKREPRHTGEITVRDLLIRSRFTPCSIVARRSCFSTCGGFDLALRSSEDRDMWLRIARRYRLYWLEEPLTIIRSHGGSMSRHADRMKANTGRVLRSAWEQAYVPKRCIFFWARVFSFHRFQCAWMYFEEGRIAKALASLTESVVWWPFFWDTKNLNEPFAFRMRAGLRFVRRSGRPC